MPAALCESPFAAIPHSTCLGSWATSVPPRILLPALRATAEHAVLQKLHREQGKTNLKRKAHLPDIPKHRAGKEKELPPKEHSDICMQAHPPQLLEQPSPLFRVNLEHPR